MGLFITNQKKLAAAVGVTTCHISNIIRGVSGLTDEFGDQLEITTGIKKITWATAGKEKSQLAASLRKFFRKEADREIEAFSNFAKLNSNKARSIKRQVRV